MQFLLLIVLLVFVFGGSGSSSHSSDSFGGGFDFYSKPKNDNGGKTNKTSSYLFEESDSFFDKCGNEHIMDDYGYCDECDDYHDDY